MYMTASAKVAVHSKVLVLLQITLLYNKIKNAHKTMEQTLKNASFHFRFIQKHL